MLQFKPYRIYVVHSEHEQKRAKGDVIAARAAKDYEKARRLEIEALKKTDTNRIWKDDVTKYEAEVCRLLKKLHSTTIGQIFFRTLNPATEIWIVSMISEDFYIPPEKRDDPKRAGCYCAVTHAFNYQIKPTVNILSGKGDSYILFNPNADFQEDTLFHELIHAYRYTYDKFEGNHVFTSGEYNTEEFLAMMMQNMYLSSIGRKQLYYTYRSSEMATKGKIYDHFVEDDNIIGALRFFLRHEYLAMLMANFTVPDFNPFRDFPKLHQKSLENFNQGVPANYAIKEIPAFPF